MYWIFEYLRSKHAHELHYAETESVGSLVLVPSVKSGSKLVIYIKRYTEKYIVFFLFQGLDNSPPTKNLLSKELYFDCWSILFCILDLITLSVAMSTTSLPSSPANQIRSLDLKPKVSSPTVWSLFSSEFACFAHINQVCQLAKLPPEMIALISR